MGSEAVVRGVIFLKKFLFFRKFNREGGGAKKSRPKIGQDFLKIFF
jgi:hypothetical protein